MKLLDAIRDYTWGRKGSKEKFEQSAFLTAPTPAKEKPIKVPYTSTIEVKNVEFKPTAAMLEGTILSYRECKSHEKMNNRRKHRQALKKFHKKAAKMNRMYKVKS